MTSQEFAYKWLQKARKPEKARKPRNSIPIICAAADHILRARKRLKRLAPRLFDRQVVEMIQSRRLHELRFSLKYKENRAPRPEEEAKIPEDLASEAWGKLSPSDQAHLRFQWSLCELFSEILSAAMKRLEEERQAGFDFRLGAITKLMVAEMELQRSEEDWLPTLPAFLATGDLRNIPEGNAPNSEIIPFPAAPDEKSNRILAKARSLQESLGLKQAA